MPIRIVIAAENIVEEADLPYTTTAFLCVLEASCLLPAFDESLQVSGVRLALHEQVQMVEHETVRENPEVLSVGHALDIV